MISPRAAAANVGLVLFGLAVAGGAGEILLRAFWPQRSFVSVGMFETDADVGYRLRAGYRSEVRVPEYHTQIVIDSKGYRVPVGEERAPLGASRVLAIGDSFTFGVGVEASHAFPERLEDHLDARWPDAWVVRNGGVGGYGPLRSAHHFIGRQAEWQPDIVVHALYVGNDLTDPQPETFRSDPVVRNGRMVTAGYHPMARLRFSLRSRSHLYAFVRDRTYGLYIASGLAAKSRYLDPMGLRQWPPSLDVSWPAGRAAIESVRDWCHENGANYVVLLVPTRWQVEEDAWGQYKSAWGEEENAFERDHAQRVLRTELTEAGVMVVDLLPEMRAAQAAGETLYFRHDTHWSARGHEIAAEAVRDLLLERGWVGGAGNPRRSVVRSAGDAGPG